MLLTDSKDSICSRTDTQTPGVVVLEYEVQGNAVRSGKLYENRFISVATIKDRKIVGWRDYMDSLAAMSALT